MKIDVSDEYESLTPEEASGDEIEFDYVVPEETYQQHHRRRHHHHHHHHHSHQSSEKKSPTEEAAEGYVFATHTKSHHKHKHKHKHHRKHHKKRLPLWLRIIIIIVSILLGLAIIAGATFLIMREVGKNAMHNNGDFDIVIPLDDFEKDDSTKVIDKGHTIKYGGKTYLLNEGIMTVTFIGYKEDALGDVSGKYMGDAIYIVAIDSHTGKTTIVGVSRETMLDVDVFSADGTYFDTRKEQLAYAYSYGNEKVTGGQNTNNSLTRLFFGMPFNNYFAIDLNAMGDLNDAIGGVTVKSLMTFETEEYGTVQEGEEVTLHGKDAEKYVQYRDMSVLESNNTRMDRQQQYIKAFLSSVVPAAKKDLSTVTNLFGVVNENADTTLDLAKVTYLASTALTKMKDAGEIEYVRLTGTIKKGKYAEMYVDDKDALETMLKVFYTPVGEAAN